jgi:hypothetical protein
MDGIHAGLAIVAAVAAGLLLVASVSAALGRSDGRLWLDRTILLQVGTASAAVASGLVLLVEGHRPADGLHFLYAALAAALPLGLRLAAGRRPTRRVGWWLVLGSLVLGGVLVRAFMTGA